MCFPPYLYHPKFRKCSSVEGVVVVRIPPDPACRSASLQSYTWGNSCSPTVLSPKSYKQSNYQHHLVWCLQSCPRNSSPNTGRSVFQGGLWMTCNTCSTQSFASTRNLSLLIQQPCPESTFGGTAPGLPTA